MVNRCDHCHALKLKKETGSTCCSNGKVVLPEFPRPPDELHRLWHEISAEGRLFRQHARSINNAVCLTSVQVKERKFQGGFNPSIVFEGKVQHRVGPLQAENGEEPRFAQLYVHDPSLEASQRFKNMSIPRNMSTSQKENLVRGLNKLKDVLHKHNPMLET